MIDTKSPWFFPSVVFSVALFLGLSVLGSGVRNLNNEQTLTVSGKADEIVTSDTARWTIGLSQSTGVSNFKDGAANVERDLKAIVGFLKSKGIKDEEITSKPVSTSPQYDYSSNGDIQKSTGNLSGYNLSQNITIETTQVELLSQIGKDISELAGSGVVFSSNPIEYYYSKADDKKIELVAKATSDAKKRAEQISKSAGSKIGKLKSASQGVTQITATNSTEISDFGYLDTENIKKRITVIVKTEFELK